MAFIPIPNGVRVSIEFSIAGVPVVITLHFGGTSPASESTLGDLASSLGNWLEDRLAGNLSTDIAATGMNLIALDSDSAPSLSVSIVPPIAGTIASDAVPANVALVTTFKTAQRGRSYRGRVYTPGLPTSGLNSPVQFTTATSSNLSAAYALLSEVEDDTGLTHVVASRFHNKQAREEGVMTVINAYRTGSVPDTQRLRQANTI